MTRAGESCFHCGEPLKGSTLTARIHERSEPVCCAGCLAVAELIAGSGLGDYYRYRSATPAPSFPRRRESSSVDESLRDTPNDWIPPRGSLPVAASAGMTAGLTPDLLIYSRPEIAAQFVREEAPDRSSVALLIEGLRCSACGWLIDKVLTRLEGVTDVSVNATVGRAYVQWHPAKTNLVAILQAIARYGYQPQPSSDDAIERAKRRESRDALKRLAVAGFGMMQVMMFAVATYSADFAREVMEADISAYFRVVSLLVSTPVMLYAGAPIFFAALRSVRNRSVGIDVPVSIALLLAYGASVFNTWRGEGTVYFDSVTMFIFFLTLGRWVEMSVRHRTSSVTDALAQQLPASAHRVSGEQIEDVATAMLCVGDVILIRRGEVVPADAVLLGEQAQLDESMLTGESLPLRRARGERISAGTLNVAGPIRARVIAVGQQTLLSGIVRLVQRAQSQKPRLALAADRAASRFLRAVLLMSAIVCSVWLWLAPQHAFATTLAVLVVACPCAFAIAMPAALAAAVGELARQGVLVTRPDALEALARIDHVIFDKTGTLTRGELRIERIDVLGSGTPDRYAAIAAALEAQSEHPIARAFQGIPTPHIASAVRSVAGCGVEGVIDGMRYRLGTHAFVAELSQEVPSAKDSRITTLVALGDAHGVLAEFELSDALRMSAVDTVRKLESLHIGSEILSGDGLPAVMATAQRCGIESFRARCTPEQKLQHLRALQSRGAKVAVLGDGINDAPVLGAADVSIAMGKGAALAHASADMIFVAEDLRLLPQVIETARKTLRIAQQNLGWAALYNFGSLPLAALGFIPPWAAALGMSLSSALVILNATRLLRSRTVIRNSQDVGKPHVAAVGST